MLQRLARTTYRRRWLVLGSWVVLLIGLFVLVARAGGDFRTSFDLPGSESQEAFDLLEEKGFSDRAGERGSIVFEAEQGVDDPAVQAAMEGLFAEVETDVDGVTVVSPYTAEGARQIADDGTIAFAELNFTERTYEEYAPMADDIVALSDDVDVEGLRVELGGDIFAEEFEPGSEQIGLLGAVIILLIAFGSVLAMGLPIMTALFGIGTGIALVGLASRVLDMPDFTSQAVLMIGIGVGIDYALFIVTRYRQGLKEGMDPEAAVVRAMDTSGRAVLFAGTTVIISMLGMFLIGLEMIQAVAIAIVLGVLMTMLASVTLLPAVLGFVGPNIDKLGLPHRHKAEETERSSFWHRWSRVVQRRPWPACVVGLVVLVGLAIPVLDLRLGFSDAGNRPESDTSRQAYDLLAEGFGPGFNGPLLVVAETPAGDDDMEVVNDLSADLNETRGVAFVTPPELNEAGDAAVFQVFPTTAPQDQQTEELVHRLRNNIIPDAVDGSTADVRVTGVTAAVVDFADYIGKRMPLFIGAVLLLSFVLLMVVFRSILVPVKAVVMNLLSIGAAYGATVAVFQWGWGSSLFGIGREGPIEAWAPFFLFAIVFGLSMDYEVFLLSRIREDYERTGDNGLAVADGLSATARVITAAAAIMVVVFGSFVFGSDRALKLFGFGLAVAVFIDATIVRMVLVPATMELLGDRNWWLPRWLDRILPRVQIESDEAVAGEREVGAPDEERVPVGTAS
ncbi:MAG: MMPL family transporter [Acidimicrobiia bacterium]